MILKKNNETWRNYASVLWDLLQASVIWFSHIPDEADVWVRGTEDEETESPAMAEWFLAVAQNSAQWERCWKTGCAFTKKGELRLELHFFRGRWSQRTTDADVECTLCGFQKTPVARVTRSLRCGTKNSEHERKMKSGTFSRLITTVS